MTLPGAEDDVVKRLLRRARAIAAEIERLQKELMEAREIIEEVKNDRDQFRRDIIQLQYGVFIALGELEKGDNRDIEVDPINPLAILRDSMSFDLKKMADERKAIRSLDGGGKP